jgi:Ricin-type beta-trefoil lectin domain-like
MEQQYPENHPSNHHLRNYLSIGVMAVLFLGLFITIQVSQQRQSERSRAAETVFGTATIGGSTDTGDGNSITCNAYTSPSSGVVTSLKVAVGPIDTASKNFSLAMYANSGSAPSSLLASANGTLTANTWNSVTVSAPVTSGATYWICYNTSTGNTAYNNLKFTAGTAKAIYKDQAYGTWPSSFGAVGGQWTDNYSMYATIGTATTPAPTTAAPVPSAGATVLSSGGTFTLVNSCGGMLASVPNSSTADSVTLQTAVATGGTNQQWVITDVGSGYYKLLNKNSGKALDIAFGATTDGAVAIQYPYSGAASQQWKIVNIGSGYYKLYVKHSNKVLDVAYGSAAAGVNLQQYPENTSCAQKWQIQATSLPTAVPTATSVPTATTAPTATAVPTATKAPTPTTIAATATSVPTSVPTATNAPSATAIPTVTSMPTATIVPGSTNLAVQLFLHGLGKGGDSANPTGTGTTNPLHPQRNITVEVLNSNNQLVLTKTGTVTYASGSGSFDGNINLGNTLNNGIYTIKIKTNQFLRNLVPGIQTLTAGANNAIPATTLVTGDINGDNVINILDYNVIQGCFSDLLPAADCTSANNVLADLTDDGHVNQFDYNLFLRELTNVGGQ